MDSFEVTLHSHAHALAKEFADPMVCYVAIGVVFLLGALLFRNTGIHEMVGGTDYESKRRRRFAGVTLMGLAAICAGVEMLSQSNEPRSELPPSIVASREMEANALGKPTPKPTAKSSGNGPSSYSPYVNTSPINGNPIPVTGAPTSPVQSPDERTPVLLREASQLLQQRLLDSALDKVNEAIQASPQNVSAFCLRGNVYAEKKMWDEAGQDYQTVLKLDGKNTQVKFDLAELQFMQKKYDDALPGFVALKQDSELGDLAAYKAFLCDLYGGHDEAAAKELEAFNQEGTNASYYFANVAWCLYHHKTEDGRKWLLAAAKIYGPGKIGVYINSLLDLGYLPLPRPPPE